MKLKKSSGFDFHFIPVFCFKICFSQTALSFIIYLFFCKVTITLWAIIKSGMQSCVKICVLAALFIWNNDDLEMH